MKKMTSTASYVTLALALLSIIITTISCKENYRPVLNITLYNKPLDTIQLYIQGKWKFLYGKGGISANNIQYFDDFYLTFSPNNKVSQSFKGTILVDTTICWQHDVGIYTSGDSTYLMSFYDKENVPWVYVVDGIFNSSLQLHDNAYDPMYYYFSKTD